MVKNKKIVILATAFLLVTVLLLSGCTEPIRTVGWRHGSDGTAILKGAAAENYQGYQLIEVYFVYDAESHNETTEYEYKIEYKDLTKDEKKGQVRYFEGETIKLNPFVPYYYRAVAKYKTMDGNQEIIKFKVSEEESFSLRQVN